MPQQQHGCLKKKGTHTALIPTLGVVETSLAQPQDNNTIRFVGATDLSKAFDKMAWTHSIAARPPEWGLKGASAQCLPQGDPASPLALMAPFSEAFRRILSHLTEQFGRQIHSLYTWMIGPGFAPEPAHAAP